MTFCTHIRLSFWSVAPDKTRKTTLNLLCSLSFTEPHKFHLDWNCNRWSWVEQNLQMSWVFTTTKQTTCRRRVNDLSCSICLYAWWQTARLWMKCFHSQPHYILLKLSATTLWYTSTFQHTQPLLLPPTTKHAAAEMFYSVSCTTVASSACMSDVEFEYIWHCNPNDLVLNEIRFVTLYVPLH